MHFVTLISDLGLGDGKVSAVKCQLCDKIDNLTIVDITHKVWPFDIGKAAWSLMDSFRHFPAGTVHIVAVDIELGFKPRMVFTFTDGYYIIAPDNGILSLAFGNSLTEVYDAGEVDFRAGTLGWFAMAADIAAKIFEGAEPMQAFPKTHLRIAPQFKSPQQIGPALVECSVLDIDRFGNVVLNLTRQQFNDFNVRNNFRVVLPLEYDMDELTDPDENDGLRQPLEIKTVSESYADVPKEMPLCLFNSSGYMEIAVNGGNASNKFKLKPLFARDLRYLRVAIRFDQ